MKADMITAAVHHAAHQSNAVGWVILGLIALGLIWAVRRVF